MRIGGTNPQIILSNHFHSMKIAIDLSPLYGRKRTGVEMYAIDLYRALLATNHQIIPIFHYINEVDNNPDAYIIPKRNRLWLENVSLSHAVRIIDADIVIFPIFPPPVDLYWRCKSKIYQTIHDTVFLRYRDTQNFAAKYYHLPKVKLAMKKLDGIITISETVKEQLCHYTKLPIINLGENISSDYLDANKKTDVNKISKWNLQPSNYYISVSTIEPRKNFDYLLEVITPVLKEQKKKLVLVGRKGWGNNERLKKLIELAGDNLIFTDYIETEILFSLYHYSYAFVLLSKDEGFGRTPFEAVACGCKRVILSDIAIFHETFDCQSLYLPLDNINEAQRRIKGELIEANNVNIPFHNMEKSVKNWLD